MTSEHLARNQAAWTTFAGEFVEPGRRNWSSPEPSWGVWKIPEADVNLLPPLDGRDVIELGCGTGYVSSWIARRGGRPVGIDPTWAQIAQAAAFQHEFDLTFPLISAAGESLPFKDGSFDVAISEYGASIWADPYRWIPEAARVLRPGGDLMFLVNGTIFMLCSPDAEDTPAEDRLLRDYFGMYRFEWDEYDNSIEFHLGYGDMIRLLRDNGFEIIDLIELQPPPGATTRFPYVTNEWARRWPSEEVWKARKR